ncbi:MAG: hypothetical protein V7744_11775 [Pseudomonadales bacterium]
MTPYDIISWTVIVGFIVVFILTLLGMIGKITFSNPRHLNKLFTVLILEVVALGILIFNDGFSRKDQFLSRAELLYDDAQELYELKDYDEALGKLALISGIDGEPDEFRIADIFLLRGDIYFNRQMYAEAVNQYSIYVEMAPNSVDALSRYARSLRAVHRYDDAKIVAERAYAINQNHYYVLNNLNNIYRREAGFLLDGERVEASDRLFEKARQYVVSMRRIADVATENQYKKKLNADVAMAALNWQWERLGAAIALYEKIAVDYPDHSRSFEDLAAIYLEYGEDTSSIAYIEKSLGLYNKLYLEALDDQDKIYMGSGIAEATAMLPNPSPDQLTHAKNTALLTIAQNETLIDDPYAHYAAAILYKKMDNIEEAQKFIDNAIRYEKRRASNPFTFDYKRLVKYELLRNSWQNNS